MMPLARPQRTAHTAIKILGEMKLVKEYFAALFCGAFLAAGSSALAEGVAVGPQIGTLGPGIQAAAYLTPNLNLRAVGSYVGLGFHGRVDTTDYNADMRMSSMQGLIDWHPTDGNFRLTAGLVLNNNKITFNAKPSDPTTTIGDNEYPSSDVGELQGKATFDKIAPYIGIGYGNAVAEKTSLSFSLDVGVMYQGSPHVSLAATGPAAQNPAFQSDLAKEQQDYQEVADKFKFYPVISIGICYQFW